MRRVSLLARLSGVVVLAGALILPAAPALGDAEDEITRYDMTVTVDETGVAQVVLDLDVDFGVTPNHGPYLTWVVRERWDDTHDVSTPISQVRASSATADATVHTETTDGVLAIRIGSEGRTFTGVHRYRVSFVAEGWAASAAHVEAISWDEVYRDLITGWDLPVRDVRVRVTGPVAPRSVECFAVAGRSPCTSATVEDRAAVMTQDLLGPRQPMTMLVTYPAGTFDVAPRLVERWSPGRAFALTPLTGGVAALVTGGAIGTVLWRSRRVGTDEHYVGVTPGLAPTGPAMTAPVTVRPEVAVRFTPPDGLHPGLVGTVIDEKADVADVTATLVDLAVRGWLRIVEITPPGTEASAKRWRFDRLADSTDGLLDYERLLLDALFSGGDRVELRDLTDTFADWMLKIRGGLYQEVMARGWFRVDPSKARGRWLGWGLLFLLVALVAAGALVAWTPFGWAGAGLVVAAVVMLARTGAAPARTAAGTAAAAQAEGFKRYLETAEADRLRVEEGNDVFSRYLPFAIAFGVTERWTRVFAELAARGAPVAEPTWYAATAGFWLAANDLPRTLSTFQATTATTLTSTPASTSSGSSFGSSGGGFAGGGGGGGGGGTW